MKDIITAKTPEATFLRVNDIWIEAFKNNNKHRETFFRLDQ
jgi:hypothetical protein